MGVRCSTICCFHIQHPGVRLLEVKCSKTVVKLLLAIQMNTETRNIVNIWHHYTDSLSAPPTLTGFQRPWCLLTVFLVVPPLFMNNVGPVSNQQSFLSFHRDRGRQSCSVYLPCFFFNGQKQTIQARHHGSLRESDQARLSWLFWTCSH